jgi:hypothetical protein
MPFDPIALLTMFGIFDTNHTKDHTKDHTHGKLQQYIMITQAAAIVGLSLGGYMPARKAAYQYLAEHQHMLPRTRAEYVMYVKKRNYKVAHAYLTHGAVKAVHTGVIGVVWCLSDFLLFNGYGDGTDGASASTSGTMILKEAIKGGVAGSMLGVAGKGHRLYYAWSGVRLGAGCGLFLGLFKHLIHYRQYQHQYQ